MNVELLSKEDEEKIVNLSQSILRQGQNRLVVQLRFLDLALGQFNNSTFTNFDIPTYITNGKYFVFNPVSVIKRYKENKNTISRDFLHIVFHCIYRHMFVSLDYEEKYWNLACDIAIENIINELELDCLETPRCVEQRRIINKIRGHVRYLTAECIYDYLRTGVYNDEEINEFAPYFFVDNHEQWYIQEENQEGEQSRNGNKSKKDKKYNQNGDGDGDGSGNEDNQEGDDDSGNGTNNQQQPENSNKDDNKGDGKNNNSNEECENDSSSSQSNQNQKGNNNSRSQMSKKDIEELLEHWKDISEKVEVDLETFNKDKGDNAGSMVANLKEVNREKYDYSEFLKKFSKMGEVMKINDDEFDYVYYTYGLNLYKNVPLVEPLEYKEVKRIKDFVIAIDTSGSVEGNVVQTFLTKTYNILKSTESFFSKINVHIIQCDAQIQEDKKITNNKEFEDYIKNMEIRGFGGTDFRPVFDYVDKLVASKEFENLKGLIYFTDGMGIYPPTKPAYQTAFVFVDDNFYNDYNVPAWAVKLILPTKDI